MTGEQIDEVIAILDAMVDEGRAPELSERIAWRTARGALRRARRVSTTTLPAIADAAQRAILVRDVLRAITQLELGPRADRTLAALEHAVALVTVLGTGGRSSSEPPPSEG